ncbi:uncharacterized protein LOC124668221 isoform X3 [Lolium rigidum]|uniref:uncharacterized protein LOC124668221 isoform X3 n=1 Tax=Lolium rigidum TaxID=89674 RepID=UPI001F5D9DE0|nr:uncharacterized protein LOC124668221 isoform X3 [Lolium rigidum]XP_047061355.1 uncharacterized protein LOC124668221 isoform X3 [Lolium rigidum]
MPNKMNVQLCSPVSSSLRLEQGLDSDLFLLQCCAALSSSEFFVRTIQERFGLSNYTSLELGEQNEEALVLHYHRVQSSHTWGFSFSIAIAIYHAKDDTANDMECGHHERGIRESDSEGEEYDHLLNVGGSCGQLIIPFLQLPP